jgi:hypothetical protein
MENQENTKVERRSLNDEFLGFRGSENYHKHSSIFSNFFITDGVKHITDKIGLCWFLDTVLSYQGKRTVKVISFQIWTLERIIEGRNAGEWQVVLYNDSIPVLKQHFKVISLVDDYEEKFDIFKIYLADNVLFLPSEN